MTMELTKELLKPNKQGIDKMVDYICSPVINGQTEVTKTVAVVRAIQEAVEKSLEVLKPELVEELQRYNKGERCSVYGAVYQLKEVGVKYNYDDCNDPILFEMLEQRKKLDAEIKERQEFLKKLKGLTRIVTEDGELLEVFPPVKSSTTSYVITFADADQ